MRKALRSARHAAALLVAILIPLLLPAILPAGAQASRRELYSSAGWPLGPYAWIEQQVFEERSRIDLLFAGSSHVWAGIDNPALQAEMAHARHGSAVVRTVGWPRSGYDIVYFVVKDLLAHRKVKALVLYDEVAQDDVQAAAHHWFRYADEPKALSGIPFHDAAALYAASVLGMPRNVLSLLRSNGEPDPAPLTKSIWEGGMHRADLFPERLGALTAHISYGYDPTFVAFAPPPAIARAEIYSAATSAHFRFTETAIPLYQRVFLERIATLAKEHDTTLVFLDIPTFTERKNQTSSEQLCWPRELPGRVRVVGVSPADLFAGLSDNQVQRLYFDEGHFNANGQRFFTEAVASALIQVADE
jgi:hypothetical protein